MKADSQTPRRIVGIIRRLRHQDERNDDRDGGHSASTATSRPPRTKSGRALHCADEVPHRTSAASDNSAKATTRASTSPPGCETSRGHGADEDRDAERSNPGTSEMQAESAGCSSAPSGQVPPDCQRKLRQRAPQDRPPSRNVPTRRPESIVASSSPTTHVPIANPTALEAPTPRTERFQRYWPQ